MPTVSDSILLSIKKLNNVAPDYTPFDNDFIMYINGAISDLTQLGIGPAEGFAILDNDDFWEDFIGVDPRFESVKTLIGLKVRLLFDPPQTSFAIKAMEDQVAEKTWRLSVLQQDVDVEEVG